MTPRSYLVALCAAVGIVTAASCGDVPTLEDGIAYITPIQTPSLAVEADSLLHDSTGAVAPLRVQAFDRAGNEILGVPVTYVVLTLPAKVTIGADGTVKAADTVMSVRIVGRVGSRLQTPELTLPIAPHPAAFSRVGSDTSVTLPAIVPVRVTVTGIWHNSSFPVSGTIVRYRIAAVYPVGAAGGVVLTNDAGGRLRDSTTAVDTTDAGAASRNLAVVSGIDSVVVEASALDFNAKPLPGSPLRFVLTAKP